MSTLANQNLKGLINQDQIKEQLGRALPRHLTPDRFIRVATTALTRTPKLQQCTPESFMECLLSLSQYGLEPDGREAHLIPFYNQRAQVTVCTLIIDYKGLVKLVRNSGEVQDIHADVVCENDEFSYEFGTKAHLSHKPKLGDRGDVLASYSYVKLKDGSESFDVMSKEEIEAIKGRSKSGSDGPWVTDWNEMAKKTVFRRHSKWLPISSELVKQAIDQHDEDFETAKPAKAREVKAPEIEQGKTQVETPDFLKLKEEVGA